MDTYESLKQQERHHNHQLRVIQQKLEVLLSKAEEIDAVELLPVANPNLLEQNPTTEPGMSWIKTTEGKVYLVVEITNSSSEKSAAKDMRLGTDLLPLALDRLIDRIRLAIGRKLTL